VRKRTQKHKNGEVGSSRNLLHVNTEIDKRVKTHVASKILEDVPKPSVNLRRDLQGRDIAYLMNSMRITSRLQRDELDKAANLMGLAVPPQFVDRGVLFSEESDGEIPDIPFNPTSVVVVVENDVRKVSITDPSPMPGPRLELQYMLVEPPKARGINLPQISHILNCNISKIPEVFPHGNNRKPTSVEKKAHKMQQLFGSNGTHPENVTPDPQSSSKPPPLDPSPINQNVLPVYPALPNITEEDETMDLSEFE